MTKPNRRARAALRLESLEVRRMLHHEGGGEENEPPIVNNFQFEKGPDFVDSSALPAGAVNVKIPLSQIPILHSNPGAPVIAYLNFRGDFTEDWGSHENITTPVFDLDGDPATFNTAEVNAITSVWARVAEDYAPFRIDIATEDPGSYDNGVAMKVDIGGSGDWLGTPAGGVAYIDNFISAIPNVVFVFPDSLGRNEKNMGEATSHELGHAFGLQHQSTFDANGIKLKEYNPGDGVNWAPIMGNSYAAAVSTWYNGQSSLGANILQDDFDILDRAANVFGYRPDDHPNLPGSGDSLAVTVNQVSAAGIIEQMTDADAFSFATDAGPITLTANVAPIGANLDAVLQLYNSGGALIATASPSDSLSATISATVPAGNYTVIVKSTGVYGYIGQYTISGQINTGMYVLEHSPAQTDVVSAAPADFTITTSETYDPASVDAGDLLINSLPADSFSLVDAHTIGFHFNTSPVAVEGLQQMSIAAGAIARLIDGGPIKAFNDTFRYDPTPLTVVSITPANGSIAQLPLTTLAVQFSEPVDPASLGADDLSINQGTITGFVGSVDPTLVYYTVSGLTSEGALNVQLAKGAAVDLAGNPNQPYSGVVTLDYGTVPYPGPLAAVAPLGSQIYDPTVSGSAGVAGDEDRFTVNVPAGQTISVVATPDAGLRPTITLYDALNNVVASAAASATGKAAILQPALAAAGGQYTIAISGAAGTTGAYTAQAFVNTAIEAEQHAGPNNDVLAAAQNIDSSFINVGPGLDRGAVIGRSDPLASLLPNEIEGNDTLATANNAAHNFGAAPANLYQLTIRGQVASNGDSDWINIGQLQVGDVITVTSSATGASRGTLNDSYLEIYRNGSATRLAFNDDDGSGPDAYRQFTVTTADTYFIRGRAFSTQTGTYDMNVWLQNTGAAPLTGDNVAQVTKPDNTKATATNASTSWRAVNYLSQTTGETTIGDVDYYRYMFKQGDVVSVFLTSTAGTADNTVTLYDAAGNQIAYENGETFANNSNIYAFRIPTDGDYYVKALPLSSTGSYQLNVYLSSDATPPAPQVGGDDFAVTLAAGQSLSVALANVTAGNLHVQLRDGADNVLVDGSAGSSNVLETLQNFVAPSAGTYVLRVTGDANVDYSLVAVRGGAFEAEANDAPDGSHTSLTGTNGAIGHLNHNSPPEFGVLPFAIDSGQSYITIDGLLNQFNLPIVAQQPGSDTDHFTGTILLNRSEAHVQFPGGSDIHGIPLAGSFLPDAANINFALQVHLNDTVSAYLTLAGVHADLTSALLALPDGALDQLLTDGAPGDEIDFPAATVLIALTDGTLRYQFGTANGAVDVAGLSLANESGQQGTLTKENGELHLQIPIDVATSFTEPLLNMQITVHFSGQFVASYVIPGPIDPVDYYDVALVAGQSIQIQTTTPLDVASSVPANDLDPSLVVLGPNGAQLGGDDNSAADGKNALLSFVAPATGVYRIGVGAATGMGEYALLYSITNNPPVANAGGPYTVGAGAGLTLDASASSDPDGGDFLTYSWDINGDDVFGDATGASPSLSWDDLAALGIAAGNAYNVKVQVTDNHGAVAASPATTLAVVNAPPQVTGVAVVSGGSLHTVYNVPVGSGAQLGSVPVGLVRSIRIQFSEHVAVDQNDLTLTGLVAGAVATSGFNYDALNHVATWTLASPLVADRYTIALAGNGGDPIVDAFGAALDGEWTNPVDVASVGSSAFPSGNGAAGGDFNFDFRVLPGDFNGDGSVTGADYTIWAANFKLHPGISTYGMGDANDDGNVTGADYTIWAANYQSIATAALPKGTTAVATTAVVVTIPTAPVAAKPAKPLAPAVLDRGTAFKLAFASAVDELMQRLDSLLSATQPNRRKL